MIWFFVSLFVFVYFFAHSLIMEKIEIAFYWNKGVIPPWTKNSEHTRIYIFTALAALLLENEKVEKYPKLNSFYKFIIDNKRGRLPLAERDSYFSKLRNMLIYAVAHPIQLEAAGKWFQQQCFSEAKKLQILGFLTDFSFSTQTISSKKKEILLRISESLSISETQLNYIIEQHQETEKQDKQERQHKHKPGSKLAEYARSCAVLGLQTTAKPEEIKKVYRKLVQKYHPDRFQNASEIDYKAAQQKFIEIQKAYEALEKISAGK